MIPKVTKNRAALCHKGMFISVNLGSWKLSDIHDEVLLRERQTHLSRGTSLKVWALLSGWASCSLSVLVLAQVTPWVLVLQHSVWHRYVSRPGLVYHFDLHYVQCLAMSWEVLEIYVGLLTSVLLGTVNLKMGFRGTSSILTIQLHRAELQSFILSF